MPIFRVKSVKIYTDISVGSVTNIRYGYCVFSPPIIDLLAPRQKRVSTPVKCDPLASYVPPALTAVTERKEDRVSTFYILHLALILINFAISSDLCRQRLFLMDRICFLDCFLKVVASKILNLLVLKSSSKIQIPRSNVCSHELCVCAQDLLIRQT